MILQKKHSIALFVSIFFSTTGFGDFFFKENVRSETEDFISRVKSSTTPSAEITGLQTKDIKPYIPYRLTENSNDNQDPFSVKAFVTELGQGGFDEESDVCKTDDCGDGPPVPHVPFFLENYSLDQLAMIGSMTNSQRGEVALIQTPDSGVVYSGIGEYIGRNNGLILSISREGMIIREKYRSPQGWQDRMATLPLIRN